MASKKQSYSLGHNFEDEVASALRVVLEPDYVFQNVLFGTYPIYETDILIVKDSKVLLIECKDYSRRFNSTRPNEMYAGRYREKNFLYNYNKKANIFSKLTNTKAKYIVIASDKAEHNNPYILGMRHLASIKTIFNSLDKSEDMTLLTELLRDSKQKELAHLKGGHI